MGYVENFVKLDENLVLSCPLIMLQSAKFAQNLSKKVLFTS